MKLIGLLTLLFFFCNAQAQNNLRIFTSDGSKIRLYVSDSIKTEDVFQANVLLSGITKDTLKITVQFENNQKVQHTVYFLDKSKPVKNKEFNYLVENKQNKIKLIFSGIKDVLPLPNPLVPAKPVIDTSYKYRDNILEHYCELKEGRPHYYNNITKGAACKDPMRDSYINYMNILMAKTSLQDEKFNIAENTIRNNCINTTQLQKILVHLDFELDKLKLTKLAYFHVTDKQNLASLTESMKLESTKNELLDFLKTAYQNKEGVDKNCTVATGESIMSEFCKTLEASTNDSERFSIFKKKYEEYCYSVGQVKLVLSQFIHDREKLDVAKILYYYCTQKNEFSLVNDVFSYTTSVAELKDFVDKQNK